MRLLLLLLCWLMGFPATQTADVRCGPCDVAVPNGRYCSRLVDFCSPSPCANGGTCSNLLSTYSCACGPSFWGTTCASPYIVPYFQPGDGDLPAVIYAVPGHPMPSITAYAHGGEPPLTYQWILDGWTIMDQTSPTFNLTSNDVFWGSYGSLQVVVFDRRFTFSYSREAVINTYCLSASQCVCDPMCQNGGTCLDGNICQCRSGFAQPRCATCVPGLTGPNCDLQVGDCRLKKCLNKATCTDYLSYGGFTCTCQPGYSGAFCEIGINECASNPCMNGATCQDGLNSYSCLCPTGFTGSRCETNINDCVTGPCKNGATCMDGLNSYLCICRPGFCGPTCSSKKC